MTQAPFLETTEQARLLDRLARNRVLQRVPRAEVEELIAFARVRSVAGRTRLFAAGDAGHDLYVVLSGWVKLCRDGPNGRAVVLDLAGTGSLFGELAALCQLPRAADAITLCQTRLLAIDGRALLAVMRRNPDALLDVVRLLGERLAHTTTQMQDTLFLAAEPRLARAVLRLLPLNPRRTGQGLAIELALSQRDMGDMTGLTRESINKILGVWRDRNIVAFEGRTLVVTDEAALTLIADLDEEEIARA